MYTLRCFASFSCLTLAAVAGCGDDTSSGTGSGASGPGSGAGPGSSTTTSGPGSGGGGGGTAGAGTGGVGGSMASGGGGGTPANCDALPPGPLMPEQVTDVFNGSEDLAFDGKGHIAGKDGNNVILADANGQTTMLATGVATAYGLRYRADGHLVVALPNAGKVVDVDPTGAVTDYVTGVGGPNGLYPDFDGNVWVTEFGGNKVTRVNPDKSKDTIVSGTDASSANGIVYDATRKVLFYTNYQAGRVRRVDPAVSPAAPVEVVTIGGAALDGMVMDACGNIYVMDQGNSRLYRVKLDMMGNAVGDPEVMADFPMNVANAQFGSGSGFDPQKLYAAGNPGVIYSLAVGVAGAPVPVPQ